MAVGELQVAGSSWQAPGGMTRAVRAAYLAVGVGLAILTLGFATRAAWAVRLWPWNDVRMSYIFLASIAAAVAAPALWVAASGELAAWAGVAANGIVVGALATIYLLARALRTDEPHVLAAAFVFALLTLASVASFRATHPAPPRDTRPTPRFVRLAFVCFAAILLLVGGALVVQVDRLFPWNLQAQTSTLFGCFFLGAATYFLYGLRRPAWVIAAGALWSFLVYDLVLAVPYVRLVGGGSRTTLYDDYGYASTVTGDPVNETSLAVYLAVLGASAVVAIVAFVLHPATRLVRRG